MSNKKLNVFNYIKRVLKYYNSPRRSMSLPISRKYFPCPNANRVQGHKWEKMTFVYTMGPESCEGFAADVLQNPTCKLFLLLFINWTFLKTFITVSIYFPHLLSSRFPLAGDRTTHLPLLSLSLLPIQQILMVCYISSNCQSSSS